MNIKNVFEIIKQAHHFRRTLKLCKKVSPESDAFKLGQFYKDKIEQMEDADETVDNIDHLMQHVNDDMNQYPQTELTKAMLSSTMSFLTTFKVLCANDNRAC